ncbi:TonB-dependent receptor [Solimonas sp. K1W22B-7]|uniref:TonB-dependent receptor n=1 Tax=Solimonas sp. K1W22B-7 TaxID=2303331 RepID=UPI000E336DA9|nr:TonB-dependent receptor [Solimonas sp. K1W22B-7]AXQ27509.1 TonB-dependent receptor [Solimonas sp. K1W22B-7]
MDRFALAAHGSPPVTVRAFLPGWSARGLFVAFTISLNFVHVCTASAGQPHVVEGTAASEAQAEDQEPSARSTPTGSPGTADVPGSGSGDAESEDGRDSSELQKARESQVESTEAITLPPVIVTARRYEESAQDVPIAISPFSSSDLRERNISNAEDLAMFVPSLVINNNAGQGSAFVIRGQGSSMGAGPGVATYFSEVPLINGQNAAGSFDHGGFGAGEFFDAKSVEVLRGPQGTLFGRNTTGGAVLFSPQMPSDRLGGYGQLTLGNFNARGFEAAISIPIAGDKLAVRVSTNLGYRDGYTKDVGPYFAGRDYDDRNSQSYRMSILYRPIPAFENSLIATLSRVNQHGKGHSLYDVKPGSLASNAFPDIYTFLAEQRARGPRYTAYSSLPVDRQLDYGFFDIARWEVTDSLTLKNIAAYQVEKDTTGIFDFDNTSFPIQDVTAPRKWAGAGAQFNEELQLAGTSFEKSLKWVVGGYMQYNRPLGTPGFNVALPVPSSGGAYTPIAVVVEGSSTNRSYAVYGQGTYRFSQRELWLDGFNLTAGFRYTWDKASQNSNIYIPTFGNACVVTSGMVPDCVVSPAATFHAPTWHVGLDYAFGAQAIAYIVSRRGYKSGGFNVQTPLHATFSKFQPEHVTDVEIGVKSEWDFFSYKTRINVDGFIADYKDIQRTVAAQINDLVAPIVENAASATIKGLELEGALAFAPGSQIFLSGSYVLAKYNRFESPVLGDLSGTPFPYAAKNKVSIGGSIRLPLKPDVGNVELFANYSYQSSMKGDTPPPQTIPGFGLVNLRAEWNEVFRSKVDLSLFVTNATDKTYINKILQTYDAFGVTGATYGEPRMFGCQLRYRFGTDSRT